MAYVIKNNMDSVNALKNLSENTKAQHKSLQQAASGEKITSAADGASEYAISEKMRVQVKSLDQDDQNAQNGISILNVASGAIESTVNILRTMKEKAIDAANDSNSDVDRAAIQKVIDQSIDQINDNAQVSYNGIMMLDGSRNSAVVKDGTYTHLTNEKLSVDTNINTKLVDLKDRSNNALGIQQTDTIAISWVKNGETKTVLVSPLTYPSSESKQIGPYWVDVPVQKDHDLGTLLSMTSAGNDLVFVDGEEPNPDGTVNGYSYIGKDEANESVYTTDGENAITIRAREGGLAGQIAGITISVFDSKGNPRSSVNASLDSFIETIQAQNQSEDNALVFQIGTQANQSLKAGFTDMRAAALGLEALSDNSADSSVEGISIVASKKLNVSSQAAANVAINVIDNALQKALNQQTKIGAETSRLEYTSANLVMSSENTQAAESVIRDADMAKTQTAYARDSMLAQAAQAMLAQSNQNSSSVLSLLQ